ncbi:DUF368 domain-containing protein [Alkalimarinus alittae]|uniref:DUF368 domain-containing protein n=1 Tax=Alkalimarinus alittae TaxID=2961619 RepID=A0ABY6N5T1_9ALTE|nr:DUF368 domain-containing protein [Alkalimarinus alittae]UZE97365.1 DUF368 domain-containing protein [Alkalimarinus alittae]
MKQSKALLFFKGAAMGAADIVPGVSGGTIAFITGIYEELINSIQSVSWKTLVTLKQDGISAAWNSINGWFLLTLFSGILFSVFTLAKLISFLLVAYPEVLWSFFFGLVLASVWHVSQQIKVWRWINLLPVLVGVLVAWGASSATPAEVEATTLNLFLSGCLAICAMILPGISGSFILLLLGMYSVILDAVKSLDVAVLAIFAGGCVVGLLTIANLLAWAFKRFHDYTLLVLTGFMIGALDKVWPWKETISFRMNSHGEQVPLIQSNVLPATFETLTGQSSQLGWALISVVCGIAIVLLLEKVGRSRH